MKKICKYFIFFLVMFMMSSCNTTTETEKISICYFDNYELIVQKSYTKEDFKLEEYNKKGYELIGWFTDVNLSIPYDENKIDDYFSLKSMNLYAKVEKVMDNFNIQIKGLIDNAAVLNPIFTWDKVKLADQYQINIYKNNVETINTTVNQNSFSLSSYLDANTSYKIKVTGSVSGYQEELSFNTISSKPATKELKFSNPYMSNMVIQRDVENTISGTTTPNELVLLSFNDDVYFSISDNNGNFEIILPAQAASFNPSKITISNGINKEASIENVLFGDVYLFAGQSNMQWPTKDSDFINSDVTNAKNSNVRFFCQDVVTSTTKLEETKNSRWFSIDDTNYQYFSAIAFMSGSILSNALTSDVPIGIITAYQGDTNIANWMDSKYYQGNCGTKYLHYNAMIYPLRHTKLSGVVWYQGCNNSAAGGDYKDLLLKLFANYRELFNSADMPFFVIGLCCYNGDSGNNYDFSYVRESQAKACEEDKNAYFISTCDDGNPNYIHPSTKRYICERVAKSIQSVVYHKNYLNEGPSYKNHVVNGSVVTIYLNNSEGLHTTGNINNLYLAGEDGKYYLANAQIVGETIVALSDQVAKPVYIKYGFGKSPFVNIFNKDGFAITPFRTDDLNTNIDLLEYNTLDKYTFHPDGSKMTLSYNKGNLKVTKANDGKSYGSVRLEYYGMIAYQPKGFNFTIVGTNSNATISFRIIEGSYEIWAYKIIDNFIGEKTFNLNIGDFTCVYNKQDNIIDTQKVNYIEIMAETSGSCSFEVKEARFVNIEKTAPLSFNIANVSETEDSILVALSNSLFAESYDISISDNNIKPLNVIYQSSTTGSSFVINKNLFKIGTAYYIYVTAKNNLGQLDATNTGYVFYLKDDSKVVICNFDFANQSALDAYISNSMDVNAGLTVLLQENGVKIESSGAGWQQFIFKLDTGVANGMTKLVFKADFSNYNGSVVLQLADTSWNVYQYNLDITKQADGTFIIDFNNFLKGSTPFTTQTLMWIMFNFSDTVGDGYILFDDCSVTK